jgi:eukaryotic-like serine/threonine-protein kinase
VSPRVAVAPFPPGHILGRRYVVRQLLGVGGMGHVHEVEALDGGGRFALKAPLPELAYDHVVHQRFVREAAALRLLDHPNIVRCVDTLLEDGRLFLVLELIDGPSLGDELAGGPLHPRRSLVLARQILDGLDHAHRAGLVHRDLKPDNVALTVADAPDHGQWVRIKLIDFGVAKLRSAAPGLTLDNFTLGTPEYMSPEQARGRTVDGRSDLYSLGVILFEMLAGRLPFVARRGSRSLLRHHISTPPPALAEVTPGAPWLSPAVEALVARALAKPPDLRWPDAAAMRDAVDLVLRSLDDLP